MIEINLNIPVLDLQGNEIQGSNLGKILANFLANCNKGDAFLLVDIAKKLIKNEPVEIDENTANQISQLVRLSDIANIAKVQILLEINK